MTNGSVVVTAGYPTGTQAWPPGSKTITVIGTVNESVTSLTVNGAPAVVDVAGNFTASITIVEGPNTITATATDPAGNPSIPYSITVYLDTQPPPMPTVLIPSGATTATAYQLCGTKTPSTSIWINGAQVVPLDNSGSWCATVTLTEGDNTFTVIAKDAAGNLSAIVIPLLILDNLPPIVTKLAYTDTQGSALNLDVSTSNPKTNFTPVTVSGQVDDSLTTVTINGITAARSGLTFQAQVPLTVGQNVLGLLATSPNGYVTTQTLPVIKGTIPVVSMVQPADGSKSYDSTAVTIQGTGTDAQNDPLQYRLLLDGQVLMPWGSVNSAAWNPTLTDLGLHTIEVDVKDAYGGSGAQQAETYVVRKPVAPPQ